jgi:hypothetical protein
MFLIGLILVMAVLGKLIAYYAAFGTQQNAQTFIITFPAFFIGFALICYHFYQRWSSSRKIK